MTDKEINRQTIGRFIARAINHGSANAIDAEFGLRVLKAEVIAAERVCIRLADGESVIIVNFEHFVPRENSSFAVEKTAHARS